MIKLYDRDAVYLTDHLDKLIKCFGWPPSEEDKPANPSNVPKPKLWQSELATEDSRRTARVRLQGILEAISEQLPATPALVGPLQRDPHRP
jgi:hypothetical protein